MVETLERATSSEIVFEDLYRQITKLELLPGTKLSESDVARQFGVSRQPVREAFTRLANQNLLLIRPQRATVVRPFSRQVIDNARFVRAALELEVVRAAALDRDTAIDADLKASMRAQARAIAKEDPAAFNAQDYEFHQLICASARKPFAFALIAENKAQVNRLCMLSLTSLETMQTLYADHEALLEAIFAGDLESSQRILRGHLDRLSPTIEAIYTTHRSYFDD